MDQNIPKEDFLNEDIEKRWKDIISIGEEVVGTNELLRMLNEGEELVAYDGFEPSGRIHIGQGISRIKNTNCLTRNGVKFVFWVADWFAMMNNKMDGDLKKIQDVGKYMIEVWKAAGMDMSNVKFEWTSELIAGNENNMKEYFELMLDISRKTSLKRILRCIQIMGRSESDNLSSSQIIYPVMQCADVFFLRKHRGVNICQLGMDQRKVNMLAREYAQDIGVTPPIIISHHMLMGLQKGKEKMSKSDPTSAIFIEDTEEEVNRKIKTSFCPMQIVENNPILDYFKHIVMKDRTDPITIERIEKHGGNMVFNTYSELEKSYLDGSVHPLDLKNCLSTEINRLLKPIRQHFQNDPYAASLLEKIRSYSNTQ